MTAIPGAWPVPGGVARPAPFASGDEHLDALADVVTLRAAAAVIERWLAGWHEPTPRSAQLARLLAGRGLPLDAGQWRAEAAARAGVIARRAGAGAPTPLTTAFTRWGLDDAERDLVAALLAFELSPLAGAVMRHVADPEDADDAPLRIAGLAAAAATSPASALDRIAHRLAPLALARVDAMTGPAIRWPVRADRRWLALVAGRCSLDGADLRMIAHDGRPALLAGPAAWPAVIAREALLLDVGVVVDPAMPAADVAALAAQPINVAILASSPPGSRGTSV